VSRSDPKKMDDEANADKNGAGSSGEEGDGDEEEGVESDEDEAMLLAKLGLSSIDAGKELEVTDPGVWLRWAVEERKRGSEQWLPIHGKHGLEQIQCRISPIYLVDRHRGSVAIVVVAVFLCYSSCLLNHLRFSWLDVG
jgi:hypothetical protein